jgi:glyoxylase-like metal-dependent hydrolase (beta-lactamase superfamily II)
MSRLSETFQVGGLEIIALSDGAPDRPLGGFFQGVDAAEWTKALGISRPEEPVPFNFGTFLIRGDSHTTLVDSGLGAAGKGMGVRGGGELLVRLAELRVKPAEIDTIVHTHLHLDHCGWDIDASKGNTLTFPNARVYVSRAELEYWLDPASVDQRGAGARQTMAPLTAAGLLETFDGEFAVSKAITMIPTPGHTPGHCSVMVTSQGEHLVILGDAAHHPAHLEHHNWIPAVDVDRAASERSRAKIAALAVEKDAVVTGGHFPILTLGRVRRVESGYRWVSL